MQKRFIAVEANNRNPARAAYEAAFWEDGHTTAETVEWQSAWRPGEQLPDLPGEIVFEERSDGHHVFMLSRDPGFGNDDSEGRWIAYVQIESTGWAYIIVAGHHTLEVAQAIARIREALPDDQPHDRFQVPFGFWMLTDKGPRRISRPIAAHNWEDVSPNYPSHVRAQLDTLLHRFEPARGGQLVLLHGEPGTGKSHLLRTLAWTWRDWCSFEYVTDPEVFFGEKAAYMIGVLIEQGDVQVVQSAPGVRHTPASERWRILVLEDAGELLSTDARERSGQGLSRLLNVVDGIIGQGLRILVLITTNEELGKLHPAVTRPGRCAMKVRFTGFPHEEAEQWRDANGIIQIGTRVGRSSLPTLADLFAEREGWQLDTEPVGAGFRA